MIFNDSFKDPLRDVFKVRCVRVRVECVCACMRWKEREKQKTIANYI